MLLHTKCFNSKAKHLIHESQNHKIVYQVLKNAISDIDECASGSNTCDLNTTTCDNKPGSYRCICKQGYGPGDYQNGGYTCYGNESVSLVL